MRRVSLLVLLACGCGPSLKTEARPPVQPAEVHAAGPPPCTIHERRVSESSRGSVRPDVAASAGVFGVVWEETDETHRGVHFLALDPQANPLGPSVEVANLQRGGAEPRVVPDGDGFAVLWTVDQPDTSVIVFRRVDAHGKPRSDILPAISSPNARALAAVRLDDGFAVAWWTWSSNPPQQVVTWLDPAGKPRGKPVVLTKGALVEPSVALEPLGAGVRATWVEPLDGVDHLFLAELSAKGSSGRVNLGAGATPSFTPDGVLFANLQDSSVWRTPAAAPKPAKLTDGQGPTAVGSNLCLFRVATSTSADGTESSVDQLRCLTLAGASIARDDLVTSAPGGVLTLRLASAGGVQAVAYQTEGDESMQVGFATLRCAKQ